MARINLVPAEYDTGQSPGLGMAGLAGRFVKLPRVPSRSLVVPLVGTIVLLSVVFVYFNERRGLRQAKAAVIEAQADSTRLHRTFSRVQAMEESQRQLADRIEVLAVVVDGRTYWLRVLEVLSRTLPPYTWLDQIDQSDEGGDRIRIAGASFANAAVTEYMRGLEASTVLEDVTLVSVTRAERDSFVVQGFTLEAGLENYEPVVVEPPEEDQ